MSGLFGSLNATVKALEAHSRALETAGKNIANVDNPGYARQRVIYGDRGTVLTPTGAESLGLEALGVEQMRDAFRDRQVLRETSLKAGFEAEQVGYQRAQAGLGQSVDRTQSTDATVTGTGVAGAVDSFFNAFQGFAANPTGSGERQVLIDQARVLSDRLQQTDQRLAQTQSDLTAGIGTDVANANRLLTSIADLNAQIFRFEVNLPNSAVDLRDQRQAKLEELAAILPIEVRNQTGGQIQVVVKNGAGADVPLVDLTAVQGTVAFTGTTITGGSPAATLALSAGSIDGALTARDGAVQVLRDNLDLLARQLVVSVNAAYNPPPGTAANFFTAVGTTAATFTVDPALTVLNLRSGTTTAAADNSIAVNVAAIANRKFTTAGGDLIDGTISNFFSQSVSRLGQALSGANARVDDQTNIEKLVRSQRDATSGVSLDEELADLMKFQRSFQASSRVFSVIDSLLESVVTQLGR
jgi:flagellar hook-associated protein 1 FlgK